MKHLLFITTSSLASNPRLVKEFECLKVKYACTVICFKHQDWSLPLSEEIKANNEGVSFIEIDRRQSVKETIISKLWHKASIMLNPLVKTNFKACAFASNDKAPQLVFRIKELLKKQRFEKVIAHNLGAFYAAAKIAKYQKAGLQLDIEDFYPGEALYFNKKHEITNRNVIMQCSFNNASTITYASKGIELECNKIYKTTSKVNHIVIINAFKGSDFTKPQIGDDKNIKCVWFSQNIGPNRGLEQVFETAKNKPEIEFHIIGNSNEDYLKTIAITANIRFHNIMPQHQLHELLSTMDIGLALESKDADLNRDICLTNKFLAYTQAGLYILATDTFGQRDFLNELNYKFGELITSNLSATFSNFDTSVLNYENKVKRWENAKSFSWEKEQLKLLKAI